MKFGLIQLNTRQDKEKNLNDAERLITNLAGEGADLVVLPEFFNYIGPEDSWAENAEILSKSPSLERLQNLALHLNLHIHCGSIMERDNASIFNTGVVFNPKGEQIARYRKIHLFDVEIPGGRKYLESETITPGNELASFEIDNIKFGMTTCYDLRFPELFRKYADDGVQVILLPAAFTLMTGKDHWELLLRARAVENQCWVAGIGQYGNCPPNHQSYGHSMVIDPWGTVVARASDGVGTVLANIDINLMSDIRSRFPSLNHRRKDLFD